MKAAPLLRPCVHLPSMLVIQVCSTTGFEEASELAKKIVAFYRLASEQLSQQDHYDWGMRALKVLGATPLSRCTACLCTFPEFCGV